MLRRKKKTYRQYRVCAGIENEASLLIISGLSQRFSFSSASKKLRRRAPARRLLRSLYNKQHR
jgi:hypothetical protein